MRSNILKIMFSMLAIVFINCGEKVPDVYTSLAYDTGKNPGQPHKKLSLLWLHHSTGDYILKKGKLKKALKNNNIDFYDINYGEAKVDDYVIGDHTDPHDFPKNFNTTKLFDIIKSWELTGSKKQHDIIMFKSCFPASNIKNEQMLKDYKNYYLSMLPTFKKHPEILFIAMTPPPLVKGVTTPENAKRARIWSKWLKEDYAYRLNNVKVFDLFDSLSIIEGKPDENTLTPQFAESKEDSHPTRKGGQAVTRLFIPWLNRTIQNFDIGK